RRAIRSGRGAGRGNPAHRRRGLGRHRRLVRGRGGQDGSDRAGRRARLAGRGRGHLDNRPGRRVARRACDPGRRAAARDLRSCRAGRLRGRRGAARARHEGPPRGGQEAGGAPGTRRPEGTPAKRGHDGDRPGGPGAQAPQGPAHRHRRPGQSRGRARLRAPPGRHAIRKDQTMSMSAWIVVGDQREVGNLVTVARSLGGPVVAGPRSVADTVAGAGLDKVVWCSAPDDVPAEASAPAVADAVAADPPRVVLAGRNPGERVLLGAVAARLKTAVLTGARSVAFDGDDVVVVNAVFGDIAEETVAVTGPVALLLDGGSVPSADGASTPIEEISAPPLGLKVIETRTHGFDEADLSAAHRVIGVGRGLKAREDLALIEELASAADAEI